MLKDKLNQFIANLNGQFVEVSSKEAIYQCMDLAYLWVFCLGFPKATIQNQYAYQVWTNPKEITKQYFDMIPNTPDFVPQDGDIVVFDKTPGNIAGHIGIALGGGNTNSFMCFDQNSPLGTNANVGEFNYVTPKLLGALRPKIQAQQPLPPIISDPATKIDFKGLQTTIETYGIMELQLVKSKLTAKDARIKELETTPPAPIYTKPIAKLHSQLADEFEKV